MNDGCFHVLSWVPLCDGGDDELILSRPCGGDVDVRVFQSCLDGAGELLC